MEPSVEEIQDLIKAKILQNTRKTTTNAVLTFLVYCSPVPELSFLPAPYRDLTRAGERRVQDNLHAHAQNDAIFPPNRGKNHIWKYFPDLACGAIF